MDVLASLVLVGVGLSLLFGGFRIARFIIPLWGFLVGCSIGAAVASDLSDAPFLGTTLGILVGVFMGLILALFAYLYYSFAVIILFAGLGYWLGSGFVLLIGFSPGVLSALVGFTIGLLFGAMALFMNAPRYVLILLTSIAGALSLVGAFLILFNQIPVEDFSYAATKATVNSSWWWTATAVVLAGIGIFTQAMTTSMYTFEKWATGPEDITPTTPHTHTPAHP